MNISKDKDSCETAWVVLNDGSTYSHEDGAFVAFLSTEGEEELESSYEFKEIRNEHIVRKIMISDLVDFWMRHNRDEDI